MLPIVLDVKTLKTAVIGGGSQACRRLMMLDEAGAEGVRVYCADVPDEMRHIAGARLIERLPTADEIALFAVIFAANLADTEAAFIAETAREKGVLVNVEDVKPQCDFHVPAIVRRGELVLTASTGGKSPALARRLKSFLSARFPAIWSAWIEEIGAAREGWRAEGLGFKDVTERSNQYIDEKEWLTCHCPLESLVKKKNS